MKRRPLILFPLFLLLASALSTRANAAVTSEYVLLVGGPSLQQWEKYKAQPHDHWWANFVHAARLRTDQLRAQLGPDAQITWLVYKHGYLDRAQEEKQDFNGFIESVGEKYHHNSDYFRSSSDGIKY